MFADGFLSKRTYTRQPAYATATLTVPSTNAFFVRPTGFAGSSYTVGYNFIDDNIPLNTQKGYTHELGSDARRSRQVAPRLGS